MGKAKDSGQITTCSQKKQSGSLMKCSNPTISWGSHSGGIPHKHKNNNYNSYCQSLGFAASVAVTYGTRPCSKGALFWCKGYDNKDVYHW